MTKPITRQMHGYTDFSYIPLVAAAPALVGFEKEETPALICKLLSSGIAMTTIATRAEWGLFKVVPFKTHLILDVVGGVFAAAAPWLFGFSRNKKARNTFLVIGAVGITAGLLTQPDEML